jgi:hypothetical protein
MKKWKSKVNNKHTKPFTWIKSTWKWYHPDLGNEVVQLFGVRFIETTKAPVL